MRFRILLYHGVHPDDLDLGARNGSGKHISARRFDDEMAVLAEHFPIVSMAHIAAALRGDTDLPDGAVAVNFDDGLANNLTTALPILERHGVPATIYVSTGYIGTGRRIWSDALENAFLETDADRLELEVAGESLSFALTDIPERVAAFSALKARCKLIDNSRKDEIVAAVGAALGVGAVAHPLYEFLDWDQVRWLDASPLIEIGAHTVDHVSLAKVDTRAMRHQIDASVSEVAHRLGRPCALFSYPEGQAHDYDERVVAHLREIGIDHAPTAIAGTNVLGRTGPYDLRRDFVGFEGQPFPLSVPQHESVANR